MSVAIICMVNHTHLETENALIDNGRSLIEERIGMNICISTSEDIAKVFHYFEKSFDCS